MLPFSGFLHSHTWLGRQKEWKNLLQQEEDESFISGFEPNSGIVRRHRSNSFSTNAAR
jgi:hypothetical protein